MSNIPELRKRNLRLIGDNLSKLPADKFVEADTLLSDATRRLFPDMQQQGRVYGFLGEPPKAVVESGEIKLSVPFWKQTDNYRDPNRTCFSSSMAMIVEYLCPDKLSGDNDYVKTVFSIGDTTDPVVQVKALAKYGISGVFRTNMNFSDLDSELKAGRPVGIGILHRGPLSSPTGGHWIVCIGKNKNGSKYLFNDPYGSLIPDAYTSSVENGNGIWYDRYILEARWTVEGSSSGWGMICKLN